MRGRAGKIPTPTRPTSLSIRPQTALKATTMHRTAAHRADALPRRSVFSLLSLAKAGAAVVVALVLSLSVVGGTYASLSSTQSVALVSSTGATSTTITAGSADLTVNADAISLTGLYPGISRSTQFTVGNSGTTSLALTLDSVSGLTAANGLAATVASGTCAAPGSAVASGSLGVTVAPASSAVLCLSVGLPTTAPATAQGATSALVVSISGVQP